MMTEMKYVLEVYRTGSFTAAAKSLYISQPSLSLMVKKAEKQLGEPIFDRSTIPVTLTEAGVLYITAARQIQEAKDNMMEGISRLSHCLSGHISIGSTTLFASFVLPELITRFSEAYPGISVTVRESNSPNLINEVQDGLLDFSIDNALYDAPNIDCRPFRKEHLLLAVPASAPINRRLNKYCFSATELLCGEAERQDCVSLSEFADEPFLLLRNGNDTRSRADKMFGQCRIKPNILLELDQQLTTYHLAAYGMGVAFVSDTLVKCSIPDNRLLFYRVASEYSERYITVYYKRNRILPSGVKAFLREMGLQIE